MSTLLLVVSGAHAADIGTTPREPAENPWLDLDLLADVTIIVDGHRVARSPRTWSADCPGEQVIEIRFRRPTTVTRLRVVTREAELSRTQEMTIWASSRRGERHQEILHRRFTFTPGGATEHVEECALQLEQVSVLRVRIVPAIEGQRAVTHVSELHVAA